MSDSSAPQVSNLAGTLFDAGYLTSTRSATFDASDNAGIRSGRLYVDGSSVASDTYSCDFTYTVPCSNKTGAELALDTNDLADGVHSVQVAAVDPAGNETKSSSRSVTVDNGAPAAPVALTVDGGSGWHSGNSFGVSWSTPPNQVAPIDKAHYRVCATDGSFCGPQQHATVTTNSPRIDGVSVPSEGEWRLRVWLEDSAGNADPSRFATTTLRYGSPPPTDTSTPPADNAHNAQPPNELPTTDASAPTPFEAIPKPSTLRANPRLRVTSARLSHGRLVVRGRLLGGSKRQLTISARLRGGVLLKRTVTVSGPFSASLRAPGVRRLRGRLSLRIAGDAAYAPAQTSLQLVR